MKGLRFLRFSLPAILVLATGFSSAYAQTCVSGNCQNGTGTMKYPNGSVYTGQFSNTVRHGKGKLTYANKNVYDGPFVKGRMQGDQGTMYFSNGDKYIGQWNNDQPNGKGIYYFKSRERYEGSFKNGKFEGQGTMYYPDGAYYTGAWSANRKNGQGKLVKPSGEVTQGSWLNGNMVNSGVASSTSGRPANNSATKPSSPAAAGKARPNVPANMRNCNDSYCRAGEGYYNYPDGSLWIGQFHDGYPSGKGTCYYANSDRYEGEWSKNAPNGEGVMYFASGRVYGAVWVNGSAIKELDSDETVPASPVRMENSQNVRIYAVIVGVGRYTTMPSLKFSDDDAYRFWSFLKSPEGGALPDNQIALLVDEDATRDKITRTMREYFLKADANDVVMFYFSGHGLEGCFLPVDFDGYNNKLRHEEIKELLSQSKAKHKICIADACHSGTLNYGLASKGPAPVTLQRYYQAFEDTRGGVALLMSSKSEELSLEDHGLRQGVFTYYLMRGLRGAADKDNDNLVTIREIYQYVYARVREYTANVQTPVLTGNFDDDMPVALRRY